jgi:SAM-dependent methyltransferase
MLDKKFPWNNSKEYYDIQSKNLFSHPVELPFYHLGVIGNNEEEFMGYIIKESGVDKNSRVVDFGCGTGYVVNKLNQFCYAEGISNSEDCIECAKTNFPNNTFKVEDMEKYVGSNMTHGFFLESLFYSNIENTFKNARNVLIDGGVLFIKEWFDVCDNEKKIENMKYFNKFFQYYPQPLSKVIEVAEQNGFECIEVKDILQLINPIFWNKSIKYHHPDALEYKEIHSGNDGGWPYVNPYQLKFKKK